MKKVVGNTIFLALLLLSLMGARFVEASGIYGQYGAPVAPGQVAVDKMVQNPATGEYVDNLGLADTKFAAESSVFFRITVSNTGGTTLPQIKAVDTLPLFVRYVNGGNYNTNKREIVLTFDNVAPGERRSTIVQVKINPVKELPAEKSIICPVNKVVAFETDYSRAEDTAQFCIERKPIVQQEVPKAGDPISLLMGLGSVTTLVGGLKLRKKYS